MIQTKDTTITEELARGDTFKAKGADFWTAGIDVADHGNRIEVYGVTKEEAEALRDRILASLSHPVSANMQVAEAVRADLSFILAEYEKVCGENGNVGVPNACQSILYHLSTITASTTEGGGE